MKVLVTGGAGFIGSHIVELLLDEGASVRVLDSFDPAAHPVGEAPSVDRRAELMMGNVADAAAVAAATAGVDAVCHQAAKVGLGVNFGDARGYVENNDVGTVSLLESLWRQDFRGRLVLASSMVVYGAGQAECPDHGAVSPASRSAVDLDAGRFEPLCGVDGCLCSVSWATVDESASLDPRNVYAATKLHQEHLCGLWGRDSGAVVVALRYHNVYGPRMARDTPYAGVASLFRSAVAAGKAPQVYEDGGQTRDFVHVRDVARANVLALTGSGVISGPLNIASGTPHTVLDMAAALASAPAVGPAAAAAAAGGLGAGPGGGAAGAGTGAGAHLAPVVTGRWRTGDVRHIVASSTRAAAVLGFHAEVGFEEGMAEFARAAQRGSAEAVVAVS